MRVNITLECTECGEQTYLTNKNKRHNPDRLELKKYCPRCRKATLHRETKQQQELNPVVFILKRSSP